MEHYSKRKKNVSSIQSRIQTHIQSVTENKHFGNKALNIKMTMILKCQENAPIHAFRGKKKQLYLLHRIKEACATNLELSKDKWFLRGKQSPSNHMMLLK